MAQIRLNKAIADSGLTSRRKADELIQEGLVTVNGKKVFELGVRVDPQQDKIIVDGKPLRQKFQPIYIMFHKPTGVLTTLEDPLGRPTISDFLGEVPARVFPIGRLDWDSEGLILLTNDGDYANRVAHPKEEVTKTYLVKINGDPKQEHLDKLLRGVSIIGGKVYAKHVEKIKKGDSKNNCWVKIVITEGKNRQIRLMFEKIGYDVMKLQRVAIGRLRIGNLERGQLVYLNDVATERVFLQDLPDELAEKKSYKGRSATDSTDKPKKPKTKPRGFKNPEFEGYDEVDMEGMRIKAKPRKASGFAKRKVVKYDGTQRAEQEKERARRKSHARGFGRK